MTIEAIAGSVVESFWRAGMLPRKDSIRIGEKVHGDFYRVHGVGFEIPADILDRVTVPQLQAAVDAMPILGKTMPWRLD